MPLFVWPTTPYELLSFLKALHVTLGTQCYTEDESVRSLFTLGLSIRFYQQLVFAYEICFTITNWMVETITSILHFLTFQANQIKIFWVPHKVLCYSLTHRCLLTLVTETTESLRMYSGITLEKRNIGWLLLYFRGPNIRRTAVIQGCTDHSL